MAALKEMLRKALRESRLSDGHAESKKLFDGYQAEFQSLVGKPLLWKPTQHPYIKGAQLVYVVSAYPRFVLVKKIAYNVEGKTNECFHGVNYATLIEGRDTVELLEG